MNLKEGKAEPAEIDPSSSQSKLSAKHKIDERTQQAYY